MSLRHVHMKAAAFTVSLAVFLTAGGFVSGSFVPEGLLPVVFPAENCSIVYAAAPTDYSYLTNAFKARVPYAESRKDDRGRSLSKLLDCGDHYELTCVNLYAYKKYNAEEVGNLSVGDRMTVEGKA